MSRIEERLPLGLARADLLTAFAGSPETWLPAPARRIGPGVYNVTLHAGPAHHEVAMTLGTVWSRDGGKWRRIRWSPLSTEGDLVDADRVLPGFSGELGIGPGATEDVLELELRGQYRPPGGPVGAVLDKAGLHVVALFTVSRLLTAVRDGLQHATESTLTR